MSRMGNAVPAPFRFPHLFDDFTWTCTLERSHDFLITLRDPLVSAQLLAPNSQYILLPTITHIRLSFINIMNGTLDVLQRDIFQRLQKFVQSEEGLIYVYGPEGFGKSFALYQLFCTLSANPNNRVLYIPDCAILNVIGYSRILRAVIAAFSHECDVPFLSDMRRFQTNPTKYWPVVQILIDVYCKKNNLTFYAIFDQYNELNLHERTNAPTDLLGWSEFLGGPLFKIVISDTTNNCDQAFMRGVAALFPFFEGFTPQELFTWRTKHALFPKDSLEWLSDITANIPKQLSEILNLQEMLIANPTMRAPTMDASTIMCAPTMEEVMYDYIRRRFSALHLLHDRHLRKIDAIRPNLEYTTIEQKCMLYMVSNVALPPNERRVFDQTLFFSTPSGHIQPAFPLVREIILQRLEYLDHETLTKEALDSPLPNDAKCRLAQHYIIECLTKRRHISLRLYPIKADDKIRDLDQDVDVDRFYCLLPTGLPDSDLFIPSSEKYNGIAFFLFDHTEAHLYCFQVTVQGEPWVDFNEWAAGTDSKRTIFDGWMDFCSPDMISMVWFVSNPLEVEFQRELNSTEPTKKVLDECSHHFWIPLSDPTVQSQFPALEYFRTSTSK